MIVAAFVSITSEDYLRSMLPRQELVFARSWLELGLLLDTEKFKTLIIDPSADGIPNTGAAAHILNTYPSVYGLAYLSPTPDNLSAVFELSKIGLQDVFVHPTSKHDRKLAYAVERAEGSQLAGDLLGFIEPRLVLLPPTVGRVVLDVFQHPHRYHEASDIAAEASVPSRRLYALLKRAGLPTPKNLLIVAKAVHGYSYLRRSNSSPSSVARKLGYSDVRIFARHMSKVFRCDSAAQVGGLDSEDVMLHLIESMSKPFISRGRPHRAIPEHEA